MNVEPGAGDVERFRGTVARRLGLQFEDAKLGFLAEVLRRRLAAGDRGCDAYLGQLDSGLARDDLATLAEELTVGETYFFRNADQFRAFTEVCIPERLRARGSTRSLHLLSAGCASGEEPYTLAILLRELGLDPSWDVSILGVDVNPAAVERAARARYTGWALRDTRPDTRERWFRQEGKELVLDGSIRDAVTLKRRNLCAEEADLWPPEFYDIVFCRNVVMYFTPEQARAVIDRITRALAPGGYLFLGHAETLRGLSHDFHLCHTHGTFYYRRGDRLDAGRALAQEPPPDASVAPPLVAAVDVAQSWVDAIRLAAERIQALTEAAPQAPRAPSETDSGRWSLGLALDLLKQERFEDALTLLRALPTQSARDPDVLLVQAVLMTHSGRLAEAEDACHRLLDIDALHAGAYYVLALCREGLGDLDAAAKHDETAAYLDAGFAMPHLHQGLLARRTGDRGAARRELGHALALLEREDAARLILFGGGFGRGSLVALCRSEFRACGGEP